jgi:hypothetical protein
VPIGSVRLSCALDAVVLTPDAALTSRDRRDAREPSPKRGECQSSTKTSLFSCGRGARGSRARRTGSLIALSLIALSLIGCSTSDVVRKDGGDAKFVPTCEGIGLTCSPPSCPANMGVFALEGRPPCPNGGGCCEACNAPNVLSGSICITAGQTECNQRGGQCANQGSCPAGLVKGGGTCGDGVTVPFAPCCLPITDGG